MSETIQDKIHLAAIKLDNLIASADEMATNTSVNASFDDIKKTIAIFSILGLLLIGIFTILFYMWRNQRETYRTLIKVAEKIDAIQIEFAQRIDAIQIEFAPRLPLSRSTSMRYQATAPSNYMPYPATGPFQKTQH